MLKYYIKLIRIPQWIKNFFVFVPLLFSQLIFKFEYFSLVMGGFIAFSLTSSAIYIFNDIIDAEADRAHPVKRNRPIASGKIKFRPAVILAAAFLSVAAVMCLSFNLNFNYALLAYFILNIFYSLVFKHIVLLDIFSIAAGFMLRVIAGALIISVETSSWLLLTTMFLSLFLAIMKRQSEIYNLSDDSNNATRKVLSQYSIDFTGKMSTIAASAVIICYALYTVAPRTVFIFGTENLIYTTPFVVFGIFRYMYLVYHDNKGENTTEIMITDLHMILTVVLYILITTLIIYKIL